MKRRIVSRRAETLPKRKLTATERFESAETIEQYERPRTRGDCLRMTRPCPFVSCKFHLYLDVNPDNGSIKLNFPDLEVWEIPATCALDIADKGGTILELVGEVLNLTRERVRQIEDQALLQLREEAPYKGIESARGLLEQERVVSDPKDRF
jgi:hypothetical protein